MSQRSSCNSLIVVPGMPCQAWAPEDVARVARFMVRPILVGLGILAIGFLMLATIRLTAPIVSELGSGSTTHLAVQSLRDANTERDLQERIEALVTSFETRPANHPANRTTLP